MRHAAFGDIYVLGFGSVNGGHAAAQQRAFIDGSRSADRNHYAYQPTVNNLAACQLEVRILHSAPRAVDRSYRAGIKLQMATRSHDHGERVGIIDSAIGGA